MPHSPTSLSRDIAGHVNDLMNLADEGAIDACDVRPIFAPSPSPPATGGLLGYPSPKPMTLGAIVDPEAEKRKRLEALLAKVHGVRHSTADGSRWQEMAHECRKIAQRIALFAPA